MWHATFVILPSVHHISVLPLLPPTRPLWTGASPAELSRRWHASFYSVAFSFFCSIFLYQTCKCIYIQWKCDCCWPRRCQRSLTDGLVGASTLSGSLKLQLIHSHLMKPFKFNGDNINKIILDLGVEFPCLCMLEFTGVYKVVVAFLHSRKSDRGDSNEIYLDSFF